MIKNYKVKLLLRL